MQTKLQVIKDLALARPCNGRERMNFKWLIHVAAPIVQRRVVVPLLLGATGALVDAGLLGSQAENLLSRLFGLS